MLQRWGAAAGIAGPLLLLTYFTIPFLLDWPDPATPADRLAGYALTHAALFDVGAWLQVTGALLSTVFFLVLLELAGARNRLAGAVTVIGAAVLLAVVVIEAAFLDVVPLAAANGDLATVATGFTLANGVFARIFPLAPAPLVFVGLGLALHGSPILPRAFGWSALIVAGLFLLAGATATISTAGLALAIVMSIVQALWIPAAAVALGITKRVTRTTTSTRPRE